MSYEIYQSKFTGAKIDEYLGDVPDLAIDVSALKNGYSASKVKMDDGTLLPDYLTNTFPNKTAVTQEISDAAYTLPTASTTELGGVKVDGTNMTVNSNGVIAYNLPIATTTTMGAVKPDGTTISVDTDGTIHGTPSYTLPKATETSLGGIIVGDNLTIDSDGKLSAPDEYTLPTASDETLGGVKVDGTTITIDADGVISGASSIDNLSDIGDVDISSPTDKQGLIYDASSNKWINGTVSGSGSGSGVSDYDDLTSKPTLNDVVITGDKKTADYNISYEDLTNQPSINSITLSGDKTGDDLQLTEVFVGDSTPTNSAKLWVDTSDKFALDKMDVLADYQSYSEEEVVVGKWTDGRPIYRKIVSCGALPNKTSITITHDIENIDLFVRTEGFAIRATDNTVLPLPYADPSAVANSVQFVVRSTSIYIATGIDRSAFTNTYAILEYTKTTDAEDSFKPSLIKTFPSYQQMVVADFEDYSTAEKVIGRWIDGRPIYRKTLKGSSISKSTTQYISVGATVNEYVKIYGFGFSSTIGIVNPLPFVHLTPSEYGCSLLAYTDNATSDSTKNTIRLTTGSAQLYTSTIIIVEYTKTTDSENSFDAKALASTSVKLEVTDDDISYIFGGDE